MLFDSQLRRNINFTMRIQVDNFLKLYGTGIEEKYDLETLSEKMLFFWFSNSIDKEYEWTKNPKAIYYIEKNNEQMRDRIKDIYGSKTRKLDVA